MNKADWLRTGEMQHISELLKTLETFKSPWIGMGLIDVIDANGEELGKIEIVSGEARFVPNNWRDWS